MVGPTLTAWPRWRALGLAAFALACNHADPYAVAGTSARNPAQGLRATFEEKQVSLEPTKGDWRGALELTGYGCADDVTTLGAAPPRSTARRVEYVRPSSRGTVREWYENTPQGLEQGFTLEEAPCAAGDVSLRVATGSLTPRLTADGKAVDLLDSDGATRLHYTDLSAVDATGRALKVAMNVRDGRIALEVDARGATYPIVVDPMVWSPQGQPFLSSDGADHDHFGNSIAIVGDTAIIGAPYAGVSGSGATYAFVRTGMSWAQQGPPLSASDGAKGYRFGEAVALSGNTAIIGAPYQKVGANLGQGAAYAFVRTGTSWAQQGAQLLANDGVASDRFGASVAIDGDTAAVGMKSTNGNAAVYVFVRSGATWTQQGSKLVADDGPGGSFGEAVALSGNTLVVGAPGKAVPPAGGVGGVYVFVRSGTTWSQQGPRLLASDFHGGDLLGNAISLSGDTLVVGAQQKTIGSNTAQGAAYVFTRSGTTWTQQGSPLLASDGAEGDWFGWSVGVAGDTAVVGAPNQTQGTASYQGAAYVFQRSGTTWAQAGSKLTAGAADTSFGWSVSISSNTIVTGAAWATVGQNVEQGTGYAFFRAGAPGDGCSTGGDCANGFCSDDVCCDQTCDGACNACAVATGAAKDGTCKVLGKGSTGTPACDTLACNGVSTVCVACTQDADCTADHYCAANGSCKPQVAQGDTCNTAAGKDCKVAGCDVCATGHCADGVCCETACGEACQACSLAFTGAPNGSCAPVPADQDPRNRCNEGAGYPGSCLSDGLCDGKGNCRDFA